VNASLCSIPAGDASCGNGHRRNGAGRSQARLPCGRLARERGNPLGEWDKGGGSTGGPPPSKATARRRRLEPCSPPYCSRWAFAVRSAWSTSDRGPATRGAPVALYTVRDSCYVRLRASGAHQPETNPLEWKRVPPVPFTSLSAGSAACRDPHRPARPASGATVRQWARRASRTELRRCSALCEIYRAVAIRPLARAERPSFGRWVCADGVRVDTDASRAGSA
jgi:hypothetical protein